MGLLGLTAALLLTAGQMPGWLASGAADRAEVLVPNQEALDRQAAMAVLMARTAPGSLIVTDDPMLAFLTGRHVPPELAVVSARRVEAGALTSEGLIALCQKRQPAAIVLFEQRLTRLSDLNAWVRGNWQAVAAFDDERWIYVPLADGRPFVAQPARSAVGLALVGLGYDTLAIAAGESLTLDMRLRAESAIEQNYTLFVHLVDEQGRAWGQHDVMPLDQRYPTSKWMPGETVTQRVVIPVAADAPPGEKLLAVGFYDADGRLALVDGAGLPLSGSQVILSVRPVVRWAAQTVAPTPQQRQEASLGGVARLVGYDLARVAGERSLELTLYWLCQQGTPTSYTVFVHVLDASGAVVAQRDQRPGDGVFPTTGWAPGEYITDRYRLALPEAAGEGPFTLALGMYDLVNGQRLPVEADGALLPDGLLRLAEPVTLR